ncbi:MAG: cell division protein FtsQ/DivIB [Lachnospiraceae bacterium]|nr:cell division protein FtsQ/DivIB [Lachnospiraceae bacterium]
MSEQETTKKFRNRMILAAAVLGVTAVLLFALLSMFRITEVTVTGNEYYSDKQIVDFILGDGYQRNTLYLFLQYKYQKHPVIPFVDDFEVTIDSIHSIQIRVYEKSIIGYVRYLGRNVYFDKNGTVVESTNEQMEGIPMIRGLYFDQLAMYEPLNVEDPAIFDTILDITQLLKKYDLNLDEIRFGNAEELHLQMEDVRISLGTGDHLEEKIARIKQLEPDLAGKSGTLDMKNYTDESTHISLEANKQ